MDVDGGLATTLRSQSDGGAGLAGLLTTKKEIGDAPPAYLNYLFFDGEKNYKYGGFVQMSNAAREDGSNVPHEKLSQQVVAEEPGYFYIYLSNDSNTGSEAFFDDFSIMTSESYIVQQTDYYPYGMIAKNWTRVGEKATKDLFQGKTYEDLTKWYDFHARQYDAALGRWFGVDPRDQFASPYLAMGNNPVMMVDPDGEFVFSALLPGIGTFIDAALWGAVIGGAGYTANVALSPGGFNNWNGGQFWRSVGMGAVSGVATAGIGSMMGPVGSQGLAGEIGRAMMHGQSNMMIGAAFGQSPSLSMYASGAFGSLTGSALHNAGPLGQIGGSALAGGVASKMSGGDFWRGAAVGATVAAFNHAAHAGVEGLKDRAVIRKINRDGFSSIDLSENPYTAVMKGMRISRLYNRGKLPMLDELFPGGMRIQDLFDYSTATNASGWTTSGGNYGTRYWFENKVAKIQLHGSSVRVGDVDAGTPYRIEMFDNSAYMGFRRIGWVHYNRHGYDYWLKARNYIWYGK